MLNRQFRVILLLIFLLTTTVIVVLIYNANKNIDELVLGNENLLTEFSMRTHIQDLRNGILSLDNNVRNIILGKDKSTKKVDKTVDEIKATVNELGALLVTDSNRVLWNRLNELTLQKISINHKLLDTLKINGKEAAENILRQKLITELNEEIEEISNQLDIARQRDLSRIIHETDANSLKAKRFQGVLAMVAVFIVMLTLWYVVNRIRKQVIMINMLNESERKVREAALVKEHFIANISHEIRTPLNAIIGFTKLLQRQPLNNNAAEYVSSINSSGENLLSIISDVLDLSKIESGMMRLEKTPLSISSLAHSVFNMFSSKAQEKNLDYKLFVDKTLHDGYAGDAVRITQVLANLLSNAIKFTNSGFVYLQVSSQYTFNDIYQVQFVVSDSGIGITPAFKNQIFERFTQADEHTTRKYGGTGLGLSIVKQIVELMNGDIQLEENELGGTVFRVILPLEKSTQTIKEKSPLAETISAVENSDAKILVVEDNIMNQSLMKHLLGNWNMAYDIAGNGSEAIELLRQNDYDIVLMDIQMPEMDGYICSEIIRNKLHLEMPVIAMTAHAFAGEKEKCISYGMNDYLSKPVREEELKRLLHHYLNWNTDRKKNPQAALPLKTSNIDLAYLDELANGNREFKRNILEQFLVQAPEELIELQKAYNKKDPAAIKSRAHNLKTTVSFLGLQHVLQDELEILQDANKTAKANGEINSAIERVLSVCNDAITESTNILSAT
jgi:signal transduction histidine kinase/CheY-like chemotaxis protein/HPt (histidine-containing phosphotransfer) domain-containing protein